MRDGVPTPVPYQRELFDYGRNKIERPLPVNLGFAGFRLHYPLNNPKVLDELIAFLGASYFRFLGRGPEIRPLGPRPRPQRGRRRARRNSRISASSGSRCPSRTPTGPSSSPCSTAPRSPAPTGSRSIRRKETTLDITATLFPRRRSPMWASRR